MSRGKVLRYDPEQVSEHSSHFNPNGVRTQNHMGTLLL